MVITNTDIADLLIRLFLGLLFVFQGYDKLFRLGIKKVAETFAFEMRSKTVPSFLLSFSAWFSSFVEFFGGIALILGIGEQFVLILLGLDLILVTIAFAIIQPVPDVTQVFIRLILIIVLLLLTADKQSIISLDNLLKIPRI